MSARSTPFRSVYRACAVAVLLVPFSGAYASSTFVIVNVDGPGEGLNDPTPIVSTGGNPGATLGEARLRAVEFAASIWANVLSSNVPILVEVQFGPLGGNESSAVLGLGGASSVVRDFAGAPVAGTWYPSALADKLAGADLEPGTGDVVLTFNSDVDGAVVLGSSRFDYGFVASPNAGDIDFVSIALHELAHGLGFQTYVDLDTGAKLFGYDDAYMVHLEHHGATPSDFSSMIDAERQAAFVAGGALHWTGSSAIAAGGALTGGVGADGHLEMYAPDPPKVRKSLTHFSGAVVPDDLMGPFYVAPSTRLELSRAVLDDVGWGGAGQCVDASQP